jgi:hypothetical protein
MLSLLAYFVGLLGSLILIVAGLMYVVVAMTDRRPPRSLRLAGGILGGYIAGVLFVWALVPRGWTLWFWTTLAAAANAEKYGHPVEHYAEGIVVAMMFCGVVGAIAGGSIQYRLGKSAHAV